MGFTDDVLIEAARMGGRSTLVIGGGRSQGKSYFEGKFLDSDPVRGVSADWILFDDLIEDCEPPEIIFSKGGLYSPYTLMKTSSKQSRYVRVWRNK